MCAQYDRFTKEDFANYLKRASRRFPKILIILDRAPQHTANTVRQTERELEGPETEVPSARMPGSQLHGGEVEADEAQSAGCAVCYPGPPAKRDYPLSAVPDAHAAK